MQLPTLEQIAELRTEADQRQFEREAIAAHYDNSAEAFSLVLGETMGYAAGIYNDKTESLETGQHHKVDLIAQTLGVGPGFRLLDAGCGWGNVLLPLAQAHDGYFHGITLSEIQRAYLMDRAAAMGIADRIHVRVGHIEELSWRDEDYDGIVFSGSLIHMHHRRAIHQLVGRLLRPGGTLFISDSYHPIRVRGDRNGRAAQFVRAVFGSFRVLSLSEELALIEEAGLDVREVRELTDSYVATIDHWIGNIRTHRDRLERLAPGFAKMLQSYLTIGKLSFQSRAAIEYIIVARKFDPGSGKESV